MSQVTGNLVLADGQATPVNVNFSPARVTPELTIFEDRATGVSTRYRRVNCRYGNSNGSIKPQIEISLPVYGTLPSGADGIIRTLRARVIYELPDGCTDAERKDLHAFTKNALSAAIVQALMRDNDPMY